MRLPNFFSLLLLATTMAAQTPAPTAMRTASSRGLYDLMGRKVLRPKGLYVEDGKVRMNSPL